jgi:sporulation protein YlmC with PRC-barrel domain
MSENECLIDARVEDALAILTPGGADLMTDEPRMGWDDRDRHEAADDTAHTLVRLTDVGLELADPTDDVRGHKVVDRNGDEVGKVDGLIVDEQERRVRFLEVGSGGFLGLGQRKVMVPVEAVTRVDEDAVHISPGREHVAAGPAYDPEVVVEHRYYEDVYGYYEYPPFWGPFPR